MPRHLDPTQDGGGVEIVNIRPPPRRAMRRTLPIHEAVAGEAYPTPVLRGTNLVGPRSHRSPWKSRRDSRHGAARNTSRDQPAKDIDFTVPTPGSCPVIRVSPHIFVAAIVAAPRPFQSKEPDEDHHPLHSQLRDRSDI